MELKVSKEWCETAARRESVAEAAYMRGKRAGRNQMRDDILKIMRKWFFMSEDVRDCVKEIRALDPEQ